MTNLEATVERLSGLLAKDEWEGMDFAVLQRDSTVVLNELSRLRNVERAAREFIISDDNARACDPDNECYDQCVETRNTCKRELASALSPTQTEVSPCTT